MFFLLLVYLNCSTVLCTHSRTSFEYQLHTVYELSVVYRQFKSEQYLVCHLSLHLSNLFCIPNFSEPRTAYVVTYSTTYVQYNYMRMRHACTLQYILYCVYSSTCDAPPLLHNRDQFTSHNVLVYVNDAAILKWQENKWSRFQKYCCTVLVYHTTNVNNNFLNDN